MQRFSFATVVTAHYNILLDNIKIGTTELENADVSMGVVFGRINFIEIDSGYEFFKTYCLKNRIDFQDDIDIRSILSRSIPGLHVFDKSGYEIKGDVCYILGMDADYFEIYIEAIPFPFYGQEFQHYVITAQKRFSN